MPFVNENVRIESVIDAISKANHKDSWDYIENELRYKEVFDMSTLRPMYVLREIRKFWIENDIQVKVYYPKWKWSKAIGYFTPLRPLDINLNGYKLNRSVDSIVGTLYHELVHMSDNANENHSYGHNGNNPSGKSNTAPYYISNIFTNLTNNENATYKKYVPWWRRLLRLIF